MRRRYSIVMTVVITFLIGNVQGQDLYFSQFFGAQWNLGPAFAGTTDGSRLNLNVRDQWPQLGDEFLTYATSLDHFFPRYHSGVGLYIARDHIGTSMMVTNHVGLQYSYLVNINKSFKARIGLQFAYYNQHLDFNSLVFPDQLSMYGIKPPSQVKEHEIAPQVNLLDFGSGALIYDDLFWFGFNLDHLARSNQSQSYGDFKIPIKYSAYGGMRLITKQNLLMYDQEYLYFSALFHHQYGFNQLDVGLYWEDDPLTVGIWYRGLPVLKNSSEEHYINQDALIFKVGSYIGFLFFGYSYDFTISNLQGATGGAHEITISYLFNQYQTYKKRINSIPCPKF